MNEETKQMLQAILDLLINTLKETNTVVGIMVDKKDAEKSTIVFADYGSIKRDEKMSGFSVSPNELNKWVDER